MDELTSLDALDQAELVRSGQVSPAELVGSAVAGIERINPELNAVIHERFEKARSEAAGTLPEGPFRGVPMVVKDLMCHTAGDPFHEGIAGVRRAGWVEPDDTELAKRFKAAGFVIVGKTNTPELGILPTTEPAAFGATRNPWDPTRSTGGSSGGSASAVAAGMVAVGHANDGGGSIRIPASACGLVGLKPTRGRVSAGPEFGDVMGGLICELAVTRSVRDTAAVLDAVHGPMPGDPYFAPPPTRAYRDEVGADPGALRIGFLVEAEASGTPVHPDCLAAVEEASRVLEGLGHTVVDDHPAALDDPAFVGDFITFWASGNAWALDWWGRRLGRKLGPDDVEPLTWALAEIGRATSAPDWLAAREQLQGQSRRMLDWWAGGFDLLLTPTMAEPPPTLGSFDSTPDNPLAGLFRSASFVPFTPAANVTGQPAISVPLHWNDDGLPIGVQLVGAAGREDVLLQVAAQLEAAVPWAHRRPPVHV